MSTVSLNLLRRTPSLTFLQPVPCALVNTEADSDLSSSLAFHHMFMTLKHLPGQFPGGELHGHVNPQHRLGPGGIPEGHQGVQTTKLLFKGKMPGVFQERFSPEQQCVTLGSHGQVHQSIHCEVLAPTQRLTKILEPGGELGAYNPLRVEKRETGSGKE